MPLCWHPSVSLPSRVSSQSSSTQASLTALLKSSQPPSTARINFRSSPALFTNPSLIRAEIRSESAKAYTTGQKPESSFQFSMAIQFAGLASCSNSSSKTWCSTPRDAQVKAPTRLHHSSAVRESLSNRRSALSTRLRLKAARLGAALTEPSKARQSLLFSVWPVQPSQKGTRQPAPQDGLTSSSGVPESGYSRKSARNVVFSLGMATGRSSKPSQLECATQLKYKKATKVTSLSVLQELGMQRDMPLDSNSTCSSGTFVV
mmetsp:Transcript_137122/g.438472  ORF Transcript_137122/g.438472 Transcript_137122/m.438472 type:complete len:261 (-) Transcript_137122:500-1282(-)